MTNHTTDVLSSLARDHGPTMFNRDKEMIPTVLLRAMLILALSSLALVSYAVITDRPTVGKPAASPVVAERMIVLDGNFKGHVAITTPEGQELLSTSDRTSGFVDVVWRAMSRQRKQAGVEVLAPLALREHADGRLTIEDPTTGWLVQLSHFGSDNGRAFAALLAD